MTEKKTPSLKDENELNTSAKKILFLALSFIFIIGLVGYFPFTKNDSLTKFDSMNSTGLDGEAIVDIPSGTVREFDGLEFVWVSPGSITMASPEDEKGRDDDELQHRMTITQGYWMGEYEVTRMNEEPSWGLIQLK
jgi:formylglycine-generating enzyme required for sulfatase activity